MSFYEKLKQMGYDLPAAPARGGVFSTCRVIGRQVFVSGCGPNFGTDVISGKLLTNFTVEQGQEYARRCMLNMLAIANQALQGLDAVDSMLRLMVLVAGPANFYDQPIVANGATQLLAELFGEEKLPVRTAVGVAALPGNIPVECEGIFLLKDD